MSWIIKLGFRSRVTLAASVGTHNSLHTTHSTLHTRQNTQHITHSTHTHTTADTTQPNLTPFWLIVLDCMCKGVPSTYGATFQVAALACLVLRACWCMFAVGGSVAEPILAQRAMLDAHAASLRADGKVTMVAEPILAQCAMLVAPAGKQQTQNNNTNSTPWLAR